MTKNSEGGNNRIVSRLDSILSRINNIIESSSLNSCITIRMESLLYKSMAYIDEVKQMINDSNCLEPQEVKWVSVGLDIECKYSVAGEWKNWA